MDSPKFRLGQGVKYRPKQGVADFQGQYTVVARFPLHDGQFRYSIQRYGSQPRLVTDSSSGLAGGSSAGLGVPITVAGVVGYILAGLPHQAELPPLSLGFVSLIGAVLIAPISTLVAPYGARLAHRVPPRVLEVGLGLSLLAVALRFVVGLLV